MGLRKSFEPAPISSLVTTKRHYHQGYRSSRPLVPHLQTDCRRTRARCRRLGHIGYSALSSLVRACWWCWPLWHCFTRTTITPAEPKNGSWREDSWCRRVRRLPRQGTKDIITYRTRSFSCRTLYLIVSIAPWRKDSSKEFSDSINMRYRRVKYIFVLTLESSVQT